MRGGDVGPARAEAGGLEAEGGREGGKEGSWEEASERAGARGVYLEAAAWALRGAVAPPHLRPWMRSAPSTSSGPARRGLSSGS